jgi:hypothetical protein
MAPTEQTSLFIVIGVLMACAAGASLGFPESQLHLHCQRFATDTAVSPRGFG